MSESDLLPILFSTGFLTYPLTACHYVQKQPWVDSVNDLDTLYKPSKEAVEAKKMQRKSKNLALAKVRIISFGTMLDIKLVNLLSDMISFVNVSKERIYIGKLKGRVPWVIR
jgi:hypothetical protein